VSETTSNTPQSSQETAAGDWTQDGRLIAVETPLGKDKLLLTSLAGEETISSVFAYELEMLSDDHAVQPESLIGRSVKVVITLKDGKTRPIHGMVAQFRAGPLAGRELRQYSAQVVPWLWYLGQSSDCRIFQNLNVPDIIEQVFKSFGFTDYQLSVARGDYRKLEFCVQYRETALNFVSRLMEEFGIFYFFRHEKERHLLVIADSNVSFNDLPDPQLIYAPGNSQSGNVTRWEHIYTFRPGRWSQKDFNFETPSNDLTTTEKTVLKLRNAEAFERFDYPGLYPNKSLGAKVTRKLMEAEEAAYHAVLGASDYPCLDTGGKFTLASHPCEAERTAYVVRRVRHEATCTSYLNQGEPSHYDNTFEAMPHDVQFRPLRVTEKPFVHGPQTAIVVGPQNAKIFTDKHGRVRVQFHWDRYGKHDDKSSCWIRVSQAWAGEGWGGVNLPHVGHEVIVAFLEGDPDRPLIVGRVHNGLNMPPLVLPPDKNKTIMRDHGDNKIIMQGKTGGEHLTMVSPRAVNLVAARPLAKPLSAQIAFDKKGYFSGSSFKDPDAYNELEALSQALNAPVPSDPPHADGASDIEMVPLGPPGFADSMSLQDINSIAEQKINSLSGGNTNAWVGNEMNTWVGGDMNQEVVGKTDTLSHGDTTNTYKSQVTDTFDTLHEENTDIHNEVTGVHIEGVGVHSEFTGVHSELTGVHLESTGVHISTNDLVVRTYTVDIKNTFTLLNDNINSIVNFINKINIGMTNVDMAELHIFE
jgi:type VI secretion system secreted protein VgrG